MTVLANVMTGAFLRDRHIAAAREKAREAIEFVGLSRQGADRGEGSDHHRSAPAGDGARAGDAAAAPAARRSHGRAQPGRDRSGGGAGRQAVAARADHRHRRARDARHHGGGAPHRGARSRPEDRRGHAEGDRGKSGSDPRLSGLRLRASTDARERPSAQAGRRQRQLRLGAGDRRCQHRDRRRRSRRPAGRQRRRQEHDPARDLGPGEADLRHDHLRRHRSRVAAAATRSRNWASPTCRRAARYFPK